MALGTGLVKLLLGLGNLVFFLANFIMSIAFFYYLTWNTPEGIVVIIQLTLVALTFVFGFGLWITCKRKFILLKLYTVVLAAFVVVQIIALVALATGSWDEMGSQIVGRMCELEQGSLDTARKLGKGKAKKVAEELDASSWFCCCPDSCDQTTWEPQMWELGLNFTQVQNTPAMTDLVTFKWPLLSCPEQFAHPETDLEHKMASHVFDPSQQGKSCDPTKGDPKICLLNPARMNEKGINGFLGKAMCNGEDNCCTDDDDCKENGIKNADEVHWCGDEDDPVDKLLTCGGKNRKTEGPPDADVMANTCTVSGKIQARCSYLNETVCGDDRSCAYSAGVCAPSSSAVSTCAGAASSASACAAAGDCTYTSTVKVSSGSTCKNKLQCVKIWLGSRIRLFAVVMTLFLFLESLMVAGTFNLGRKATSGDGVWYHDSGELTDDMSAMDALGDYNKAFK